MCITHNLLVVYLDLDRPIMAASGNENIVDIDDTEQNNDVLSSDIVCIYPKNDKNPVTVRLSDYESLEDICI